MNKLSYQPYKGTRDYYPADKRVQNYIFSTWRKVVESFGYEEYGAPTLEPLDVYVAKSGQELAGEQTYSFIDRGGRTVAIRPEMTPSVSRMVAAKRQELAYPSRLYSIANFMRYERPQHGREREFWQLNVDIFGDDTIASESEIIVLSDEIMKKFGAKSTDYVIKVNNRKLVNFVMSQYLELDANHAQSMIKLFDRKDKIELDEFNNQATEILGDNSEIGMQKIQKIMEAESMADLPSEIRNSACISEIQDLFTMLEHAGVKSAIFDITLMRGFDYYTGMVFEVFDANPENSRSLFGGGRYDGLVGLFGVDPISAVGVAPGGTTTEDFLRLHNLLPALQPSTDVYVVVLGDVVREANDIATKLREQNINVELDLSGRKIDNQIKTAIKKEIPYLLFIGEEEVKNGKYTLKNVAKAEESKLNIAEIVEILSKYKEEK